MTKIETLLFDRASPGSGRQQQISSNFFRSLGSVASQSSACPLG